ncbi:ABC transporter ATP-binding protein [Mesorhizobium sp. CAU 1741]|uniref:ABC transporter ATP-binding protein n=1 Tax=Mesorhizobium sp. CAU 1741 TaxID=3140366 RepID=UPI00325C2B3A
MTPLIETRGLTRHFGGLKAVEAVDFQLEEGEIRAIIGPNGAGKTTFVSLICGRIAPTSGEIIFAGRDITRLAAHERVLAGIAYTFQITSIFPRLTVYDNVALPVQRRLLKQGRVTQAALDDGVADALARVGLSDRAATLAGSLAYGHQRLLEVAMGLALQPRLLILDEPTQGLSDGEIEGFIALVRDIARDATVLLIEHNMPVVMELAQKITVLNFGQVLAEGTPAEIRGNVAVQDAYLGTGHD